MIQSHHITCQTWWSSVMAGTCSAANGHGSLVLTDDVTDGRGSRMNPKVKRAALSDQTQPNAAELLHSTNV